MADLYGTSCSSSPESEDMSSILHNLIHNSFTSLPSSSPYFKGKQKQLASSPPVAAASATAISSSSDILFSRFPVFSYSGGRFREGTSSPGSSLMVCSSTGLNFSDPRRGFVADADECAKNTFRSICTVDSDGITSTLKRQSSAQNVFEDFGFDCEGADVSEAPGNPVPPRSSKRNRAAEVHNLSEKRRRSRINEKMKALQNLIPNSNKSDKASMLDEAIEYLKQLQLQVQMLSMRNGLSLHPLSMLGSLHPTQLPQPGIGLDAGEELLNMKGGGDTFSGKQKLSMQVGFDFQNQRIPSDQPNLMPPMVNIGNLETSFGLEPPLQSQYGPFNRLASSKEICREDRLSQLQLDMNCSGQNSSSGISS